MLGPIDYIVVGIKGNNFDGSVLEELAKAVDSGVIRVVDLFFIVKEQGGNVFMAEVEDQSDDLKEVANMLHYSSDTPLFTEEDVNKLAEHMDEDTTAGVLVIEQLWAKGLKQALLDKGAVLLDEGRVHPDNAAAGLEELQQTKETEE